MTGKRAAKAAKAAGRDMRHARIELPVEDYERLQRASRRIGLSISAFIRMAVLERIETYETKGGQG